MANLDVITLKHIIQDDEDKLIDQLMGEGSSDGSLPQKLEAGELVIRRMRGFIELWSLDQQSEPAKIEVNVDDIDVPFDPEWLQDIGLGELYDVNLENGIPGGEMGPEHAGMVLTWDGAEWAPRVPPGLDSGAVAKLDYIGDVNYAHFAATNKFGPEYGDTIQWLFNEGLQRYEWAPVPLTWSSFPNVATQGSLIVLQKSVYSGFRFGNITTTQAKSADFKYDGGAKVVCNAYNNNGSYQQTLVIGETYARLSLDNGLELSWAGPAKDQGSMAEGIYFREQDHAAEARSLYHLPSLLQVRNDWGNMTLGEIGNVNDVGILQGQVLAWDSIQQAYVASSGVAPDLSLGSVGDLNDVEMGGAENWDQLIFDGDQQKWISREGWQRYVMPESYPDGWDTLKPTEDKPRPCSPDQHGRIALIENVPHMCMACRRYQDPSSRPDQTAPINELHEWVRILVDGYNRPTSNTQGSFSPWETAQAIGYNSRRDPLAEVSYTGQLGSMENVSTVGAFAGSAPVYDPNRLMFVMGYPALNLPAYSIGDLGDVDASNPAIGYGLLWDGEVWKASSLEQQLRLDDLQDVGFGSLGVQNTKLVAAYALTDMVAEPYYKEDDVSAVLAVSAQKVDANLGSCFLWYTPDNHFYPTSLTTLNRTEDDSLAERLDRYVRWEHDGSWQTIDGDGCVEIWFFPTALLETRCIMRKVASIGSKGGWKLDLLATGGLRWNVNGPEGFVGFGWESEINIVSTQNWHHVAITKENDKQRIYLDGDLLATITSQAPWTGDGLFVLGRNDLNDQNTLTHHMFKGYLHDLRVTKGRPKYTGDTYTQPTSLEAEIIDTTPNAGDVLMYDGTRWTNAGGVQADLSSNSINDLADVDTGSRDPENGDALVWTGQQWEPGIPGIGATWSLDDMTDVSTYYQSANKLISFDQAQAITFTQQFSSNPNDYPQLGYQGNNNMLVLSQTDEDYHCGPGGVAELDARTAWMAVKSESYAGIKAMNVYIENVFFDCFIVSREYHVAALHYAKCPDRSYDGPPGPGDLLGDVPENFIPCWGVIQDHVAEILEYGQLMQLGDCDGSPTPGQALTWDGAKWTPSSEVAADVSQNSINDLADVCISGTPNTDQALMWNGSCWHAKSVLASILDLEDMNGERIEHDPDIPIPMEDLRGGKHPDTGQSYTPLLNNTELGVRGETIIDWTDSGGTRGHKFLGGVGKQIGYGGPSYLTAMPTELGSTILTAPVSQKMAWLELTADFARFGDNGHATAGAEGLRLGTNWRVVYEDASKSFADYASNELPHKAAIASYVTTGLGNLNLNNNTLDDLGDVDTAGKQNGYALMWNGTEWSASAGVAADVSFSSIGELLDMEKGENSAANVNDGWVSFDVPELRTSRPGDLFEAGGLKIPNQIGSGWFGFSSAANGAPELFRPKGQLGSILDVFLRAQTDGLVAQGDRGISYTTEPALSDLGLPCVSQVRRLIAQEATDYTALFWMDGNTFVERNYNWPLDLTVNTQPNPALWSHFPGEYSYKFLRASGDRITWTSSNGAPINWPTDQLWSFECWIFTESTITPEENEYILCADSAPTDDYVKGMQLLLTENRTKLVFTINDTRITRSDVQSSLKCEWNMVHDQWHHVYCAHEGGGRMRMYVDGVLVDEFMQSLAFSMIGGISWGGRIPQTNYPTSKRSYFSGYLDDMRISQSWLMYEPDKGSIPVPVDPVGGSAWKATTGTLAALDDVQLNDPAPSNGKVLMYDGVSESWYAGPADAVAYDISGNSITDLSDVDTTNSTPDNDDVLRWDSAAGNWQRSKVDGNGGVRPLNARSITAGFIPNSGNLYAGELFINMADRKLYALDEAGDAFSFATGDADAQYDRIVGGDF